MTKAIFGYTGFVGSNLQQFYKFDYFYNSTNFHDAKNKSFDTVFCCCVPAVKWKANKYPQYDFESIRNIKLVLDTISAKKFILISTIDVYENVNKEYDEYHKINAQQNHTYGQNRFLFEEYVQNNFENYHIIRLPALFGKGLKKNVIYDLIHNNNVNDIPFNSSFQWYYLNWLKTDIDIIIKNNIRICNLFTEPLHTQEIFKAFKSIFDKDYKFQLEHFGTNAKKINYNTCSKYSNLFGEEGKYIRNKEEVLNALTEYLKFEKIDKSKLCVSNICVNDISQLQFAVLLKLYGIKNVQIAPTKLIESWEHLEKLDLSFYRKLNLNVYSFQSITYTLNNLNIFSSTQDKLLKHLKLVIDCAVKNKVNVLVFGCPRNRKIIDVNIDNKSIFIDFFKRIGDYCYDKNIIICLENNSKKYNCNFINTIDECAHLIRKINKKNIKMMVDLGNAVMENDHWYYLKKHMDIIYNIDVSNPNMADFVNPHESNSIFNFILKNNNYNNMRNLEMLTNNSHDELNTLNKSLYNFINIYKN